MVKSCVISTKTFFVDVPCSKYGSDQKNFQFFNNRYHFNTNNTIVKFNN